MSDTNASSDPDGFAADKPFFHALLTPHRSLGRTGFTILMVSLLFGWTVTGIIMISHGAWPIFGFFGLDLLLIYIAFRLNYRAARAREEVSLSRTSLDILKTAPSGRREAYHFNPFRARFEVARHDEIGIVGMAVNAEGRTVPIGAFLEPEARDSFAAAFSRALATAKGR
jgi:uncharacterized membrane protein